MLNKAIRNGLRYVREHCGLFGVVSISVLILCIAIFKWRWFSQGGNSDTIRNLVLTIGGIWAGYAVWLAALRVDIMQNTQISESIGRAAEQLSSTIMSVRILAILSLEKIAINGDAQICQDIINVLCAHLRDNHPANLDDKTPKQKDKYILFPEDISHIINVLCNINWQMSASNNAIILNLSNIDFSGVSLSGLYLAGARLTNADLSGADLSSADLSGANLSYSDLPEVNLSSANLSGTDLSNATLSYANLSGADLSGADLSNATLSYANLSGADWLRADLSGAKLLGIKGLDTAKNLETVKGAPREFLDKIAMRGRGNN